MSETKKFEDGYPFIVQAVMKYIDEVKSQGSDAALIDIITDFCFKNNLEVELVGDAISSDVYFKSFIEKDCQLHRYFRVDGDAEQLDEW